MLIKICGMREDMNIQQVEKLNPDFMGFIFYEGSKRYVGKDFEKQKLSYLNAETKPVAVFVNELIHVVQKVIDQYDFQTIQLHGSESPGYCETFKNAGITVLKAFGIHYAFNWNTLGNYKDSCDYFLFDTSTKSHGGSGGKFDWKILNSYTLDIPFFLSGGIGIEDVNAIRFIKHPQLTGIDINSRFEFLPAMKDVHLLREFMIGMRQDHEKDIVKI